MFGILWPFWGLSVPSQRQALNAKPQRDLAPSDRRRLPLERCFLFAGLFWVSMAPRLGRSWHIAFYLVFLVNLSATQLHINGLL